MNKRYLVLLAAVFFAVTGCVEKELAEENPSCQKGARTLKAVLEGTDDVDTKTMLGTPEDNVYPVLWSAGDEIKILTAGHRIADGEGTKMTLKSGVGERTGVFEGDIPILPEDCNLYYAVYPYTLGASIGGEETWYSGHVGGEGEWDGIKLSNYVWLPFPSVQKYAPSSFAKDYNPAIAVFSDATEGAELRFKNACGLLQINLTGNVTVGKITLTSHNNQPLWGNLAFRYRMRENPFWEEYNLFFTNNGFPDDIGVKRGMLTLDCGSGVKLTDTPTDFYFAVPVTDNNGNSTLEYGFTIRVYDVDGNEVYTKIADADNSIIRSKIRQMPVVDIRKKTLTDLSASGTANSYIVTPNTTAKFFAGYRGCTTYPVGNISHAVILWETTMKQGVAPYQGAVLETAQYNPSTGYVTVKTGAKHGNALVAVKDAADNILWSWHIWVTDYNPDSEGAVDVSNKNMAEFMDRNLGAISKISSTSNEYGAHGLLYEWGRKDPIDFIEWNEPQKRYMYFPTEPFIQEHTSEEMGNLDEYSIAHPTTYLFEPNTWHGQAGPPFYNWGKTKSEYDPCPPGWQVADFDVMHAIVPRLSETADEWRTHYDNYDSYVVLKDFTPYAFYPIEQHWTNKHNYFMNVHAYGYDGWQGRSSRDQLPVRCQRSSTVTDTRQVIDLSAKETANSYVVRPNKSYKFKANVKGNSNISVGAVSYVDFVYITENSTTVKNNGYGWYGYNSDETIIRDVYYENDYIYFKTSLDQTYGNAIISIKDMHGNVLWSWHIWSVDYNPSISYDNVRWGDENVKMMKMNLGALTNAERTSQSLGLMYQWGRKDPYPSAIAFDSNQSCLFKGMTPVNTDYGDETSTILYSVQHPNEALEGRLDGGTVVSGNWLKEADNTLWGDVKTMYDPCPPGWKVPARPTWEGQKVFKGEFAYGLLMDEIWYPASGYRHFTSFNFNSVGAEGHYWYSTAKDDGTAYSFYFDDRTIDLANHADYKAQCNPVRCVSDEMPTVQ